MTDHANAKSVCSAYKKQGSAPAAAAPAQPAQQKKAGDGSSRKYLIFKSFGEYTTTEFVQNREGQGGGGRGRVGGEGGVRASETNW
jgi:hypothetical protein